MRLQLDASSPNYDALLEQVGRDSSFVVLPRYRKLYIIYHQGLYHDMNIYHDIELTVIFARHIHTLHCKFKFKLDVYHKQKLFLFIRF